MYGMQRANGDWFALDDHGRLRMPVFRNSNDAMLARNRNAGMLLFKPVLLSEPALSDIVHTETEGAPCFWLVNNPSVNLRHGDPLEHAQMAELINNSGPSREDNGRELR
jgi:hypothetical protein